MEQIKPWMIATKMTKEHQKLSMKIIGNVGSARSSYIEAMMAARKNDFEKAIIKIEEGDKSFIKGHQAHGELLQAEAIGEEVVIDILMMNAEDQLSAAETFKIIAGETIELCRLIHSK